VGGGREEAGAGGSRAFGSEVMAGSETLVRCKCLTFRGLYWHTFVGENYPSEGKKHRRKKRERKSQFEEGSVAEVLEFLERGSECLEADESERAAWGEGMGVFLKRTAGKGKFSRQFTVLLCQEKGGRNGHQASWCQTKSKRRVCWVGVH